MKKEMAICTIEREVRAIELLKRFPAMLIEFNWW